MVHAQTPESRPPVLLLADRLEALVRDRGLSPGDRFLTSREAAKHLGVRQQMANRALQILEHRGILVRRQRLGAVVARPAPGPPALRRLHLLVQEEHGLEGADEAAAVQVGLQATLPGCAVEAVVVPGADVPRVVDEVVRRALRGEGPEGLVLVRCGYAVQRRVVESGLPAVLHGTPFPGIPLSSLDEDARQKGRLQADALLARGCRRVLVLRRDRSLPGDVEFLRGLRSTLAGAGLLADAVDQAELAPHGPLVAAELRERLADAGDGPTGIVATTRPLAEAAFEALSAAGLDPARDVALLSNRAALSEAPPPPYPYLRPLVSSAAQGQELGALLRRVIEEPGAPPLHRAIPCELVEP